MKPKELSIFIIVMKKLHLTTIAFAIFASIQTFAQSINESDWQVAFNNKILKGKVEVVLSSGRADIVTDTYAVEVDKASKYKQGIQQALRYAKASKKKPGLALYLDGELLGQNFINLAKQECEEKAIRFWLINEYVTVDYLIKQKGLALPKVQTLTIDATGPLSHWITLSSGVRHNRSCRWFERSNGKLVRANEGRACKQCGG